MHSIIYVIIFYIGNTMGNTIYVIFTEAILYCKLFTQTRHIVHVTIQFNPLGQRIQQHIHVASEVSVT